MKTFKVRVQEIWERVIIVRTENEEAAGEQAREQILVGATGDSFEFSGFTYNDQATEVEFWPAPADEEEG